MISVGAWNINVYSRKKLHWLTLYVCYSDVFFLLEAGHNAPLDLLGYQRYGSCPAAAAPPRGAGRGRGIFAYVKGALAPRIKKVCESDFWLWLRLREGGPDGSDLFVGAVYIPPATSTQWRRRETDAEKVFEQLSELVTSFQQQGQVLLFGDFNARVGSRPDIISADERILETVGAEAFSAARSGAPILRAGLAGSGRTDRFGRLLIDTLCIPAGCIMMNGRTPGDVGGAATYVCRRGSHVSQSCIDYGIVDARLFPHIISFNIIEQPEEPSDDDDGDDDEDEVGDDNDAAGGVDLRRAEAPRVAADNNAAQRKAPRKASDHNVLRCAIPIPPPSPPSDESQPLPPRPRFNPDKRMAYVGALQSPESKVRLDALAALPPEEAAREIVQIVHEAACAVFNPATPNTRRTHPSPAEAWIRTYRRGYWCYQDKLYSGSREDIRQARRVCRLHMRRSERQCRARHQAHLLDDLRHNPRQFWTGYKGSHSDSGGFTHSELNHHWRKVLSGVGKGALPEVATDLEAFLVAVEGKAAAGGIPERLRAAAAALNEPISEGEVLNALQRARAGAAAGLDGIGADLWKGAYVEIELQDGKKLKDYVLTPYMCTVLDKAFRVAYPPFWNEQPLTSVFKKGDASKLINFRPIQCQSALPKFLSLILPCRLHVFAEACSLRAEGQAAFRFKRRTSDHVFVLRHLIDRFRLQRSAARRPSHLFCCFVDSEKAYDSVRRDLLMDMLASYGLTGHVLRTIASMYWSTPVRTKSGNSLGIPFEGTCGVRQGDPLSPLLFGLFIDRFEQFLDLRCPEEGVELGGRLLRMLLYADDMVLLSPNLRGLQRMLDVLHMFCRDTHMKVNVDKTEVVVFGLRAFGGNTICLYDGKPITVSTSFKYLGVVFHSTRGMNAVVEQLTGSGRRAIWAMHGRCKTRGIVDISMRLRLFRILCEPVLGYCCAEVWAPGELSSLASALKSPLQVLQNDYVRYISGLRRNTPIDVLC